MGSLYFFKQFLILNVMLRNFLLSVSLTFLVKGNSPRFAIILFTFLLYFENKEIFCFCVWTEICGTFLNLIHYWMNEYWMSLSRSWSLTNTYYMICLHSLNDGGKGWTWSPTVTFFPFVFNFTQCKLIIRNIFLLTYLGVIHKSIMSKIADFFC